MKRFYKIFFLSFLSIFILHSLLWVFSARSIETILNNYVFTNKTEKLTFGKVQVSGFPLSLKANISELKLIHKNGNVDIAIKTNDVKISANIFFTKFKIILPKEIHFNYPVEGELKDFALKSEKEHIISVKEASLINTHKIFKNIIVKELPDLNSFRVENLTYNTENIILSNTSKPEDIFKSKVNFKSAIIEENKSRRKLKYFLANQLQLLSKNIIPIDVENLSSNFEIETLYKYIHEQPRLREILIKNADISFDKFNFNATGKIELSEIKYNSDISVKISNLDALLVKLINSNFINSTQSNLILTLFETIYGTKLSNKFEFKIFTTKEGETRLGNIDINSFFSFIKQFGSSK